MQKDYKLYLDDIIDAINKIEEYTRNIDYKKFAKDTLVSDAVIRNLEIIGEAVKQLPLQLCAEYKEIEWKKIAGFRDILIHAYFGVDLQIVWDIIKNKLPSLKEGVEAIRKEKK